MFKIKLDTEQSKANLRWPFFHFISESGEMIEQSLGSPVLQFFPWTDRRRTYWEPGQEVKNLAQDLGLWFSQSPPLAMLSPDSSLPMELLWAWLPGCVGGGGKDSEWILAPWMEEPASLGAWQDLRMPRKPGPEKLSSSQRPEVVKEFPSKLKSLSS